jgi:hypothetical protein
MDFAKAVGTEFFFEAIAARSGVCEGRWHRNLFSGRIQMFPDYSD